VSVSGGTVGTFTALASTGTLNLTSLAKAINYQMVAVDTFVSATGGAGGITITLPPAPGDGRICGVAKVDAGAGAVTVVGSGGVLINGAANYVLTAQSTGCILIALAGVWSILTGT
jgi:hypothetical protein